MKKETIALKIRSRSIIYILMCLGGIVALVLIFIFPHQKKLEAMDIQIVELQEEKKRQESYIPLFKAIIENIRIKVPNGLPFPKQKKLKSDETASLKSHFKKIAEKNRFSLESIKPDMGSLVKDKRHLKVKLSLKGDFIVFQNVLMDFGRLPFFERIEQAKIKSELGVTNIDLLVLLVKDF